jgi:hypothetical protein
MRFRLIKICFLAAAVAGVVAPSVVLRWVEAQKQGASLWYPVATVKRVSKPNRQRIGKLPSTQRTALLTLQWHLLQPGNDNRPVEADSSKQFQTGDQVKLGITTNQDGYLYIVSQRPDKDSVLLFPDLRIHKGLNRVLKDQEYVVPSYCTGLKGLKDPKDCWMEFAAPAGTETLIVVFSRDKITTLPNKITEPGSPVKRSIVDELFASSQQKVEQFTGELTIPNQKAVRYATRVQNTNPKDNEELIATIVLTHGE